MSREKKPEESYVEMTELVLPNQANPYGNVLGGHVLHLIDIAGAISASRFCNQTVVTAGMDSVDFRHPVKVGEVIVLKARVNWAGKTSMEVSVDVFAENTGTGSRVLTCSAYVTYVAIDEEMEKIPVPILVPQTEEEKARFAEAAERRKARLQRLQREEDREN